MEDQQLTEPQLQALLRLKRHEQPPPGYFDDLLSSIHRRQREEMLRRPAWRIFAGRVRAFFSSLDWKYAGAMAAVLVVGIAVIQFVLPGRPAGTLVAQNGEASEQGFGTQTPFNVPTPQPQPQLFVLQLQPGGAVLQIQQNSRFNPGPLIPGATGPTRFAIETQPASYEPPQQIRF